MSIPAKYMPNLVGLPTSAFSKLNRREQQQIRREAAKLRVAIDKRRNTPSAPQVVRLALNRPFADEQIEELVKLLDIPLQTEIGSDGFIYGNYIEFPKASEIDNDDRLRVLDILGIQVSPYLNGASREVVGQVDEALPPTLYEHELPASLQYYQDT